MICSRVLRKATPLLVSGPLLLEKLAAFFDLEFLRAREGVGKIQEPARADGVGRADPRRAAPHPIVIREAHRLAGDVDEGPADRGKAYRVDELHLDVEQCGATAGIDRDLAERAADRGHERKLMLEFDLCRGDRHEAGEVYGDRRADNGGEGALLRDAHVLLRIDVRQFCR